MTHLAVVTVGPLGFCQTFRRGLHGIDAGDVLRSYLVIVGFGFARILRHVLLHDRGAENHNKKRTHNRVRTSHNRLPNKRLKNGLTELNHPVSGFYAWRGLKGSQQNFLSCTSNGRPDLYGGTDLTVLGLITPIGLTLSSQCPSMAPSKHA